MDHPEGTQFRNTKDVDVVVEIFTYSQFAQLEERLRLNGFDHDTSEGAPICRWVVDGCKVDIMPSEPANVGMSTRWFPEVLKMAARKDLGDGVSAMVISPPLFLATKIEAFRDRGKGDYYGSHDLEDIITLVDGCASIAEQLGNSESAVRTLISSAFREMLIHPDFRDALPGHQPEKARIPLVRERFTAIAELVPG